MLQYQDYGTKIPLSKRFGDLSWRGSWFFLLALVPGSFVLGILHGEGKHDKVLSLIQIKRSDICPVRGNETQDSMCPMMSLLR